VILPTEEPSDDGPVVVMPDVLPAPLYFIAADGQIWRMERDAVTMVQITTEPVPVTDFAVSPVDSTVAYISGNDLYHIDAFGGVPTMLVDGPPPQAERDQMYVIVEMVDVLWSPDGTLIAYGMGGVNVVSPEGGASTMLLASDTPPGQGEIPEDPIRYYWPSAWSPDGGRMLVDVGYWPEAGTLAVLDLSAGTVVELTSPDGLVCCNPTWSADGSGVYFASPYLGMIVPGLWWADAATGTGVTLIAGTSEAFGPPFSLVDFPQQLDDGWLYFFFTSLDAYPEGDAPLTMTRAGWDGVSDRVALRADSHVVGEALWAPDGSGAVIMDMTNADPYRYPQIGPLVWLPSNGIESVQLGTVEGHVLRWGQ
jgi:Tol biopolymer transport system component